MVLSLGQSSGLYTLNSPVVSFTFEVLRLSPGFIVYGAGLWDSAGTVDDRNPALP